VRKKKPSDLPWPLSDGGKGGRKKKVGENLRVEVLGSREERGGPAGRYPPPGLSVSALRGVPPTHTRMSCTLRWP
jgi:hypothetical protein